MKIIDDGRGNNFFKVKEGKQRLNIQNIMSKKQLKGTVKLKSKRNNDCMIQESCVSHKFLFRINNQNKFSLELLNN